MGCFAIEHPDDDGYYAGVGSGFVAIIDSSVFIVTAAHVLADVARGRKGIFGLRSDLGRPAIPAQALSFRLDEKNDVAVAPVDPKYFFSTESVEGLFGLSLREEPGAASEASAEIYALLGFPHAKNDWGRGNVVDWCQPYTFGPPVGKPKACTIEDAVCFDFLPKRSHLSDGRQAPRIQAGFEGVSGGPVLQLRFEPGRGMIPDVSVLGTLAEYDPNSHCFIAGGRKSILDLTGL